MGNISRTLEARPDWSQSQSGRSGLKPEKIGPGVGQSTNPAGFSGEDDPLRAARGVVLGVALGSTIWAVILWAVL
jgi:hypothetical protein